MGIMSNKLKHDGGTTEGLEDEKMSLVSEKRKVELELTNMRLFYETREHEFEDELNNDRNKLNKEIVELDVFHKPFLDEKNEFKLDEVKMGFCHELQHIGA